MVGSSGKHAFSARASGAVGQSGRNPNPSSLDADIKEIQARYRPDMKVSDGTMGGGLPVGGATPGEADDHFQTKLELLQDPAQYGFPSQKSATGALPFYSPTDSDVAMIEKRKRDLQQAGFFEYISTMVDIRQPGMLAWLNDLVPEYAEAQMQQLKSNQELYAQATKIANFGLNSRADLMLQYMLDTGQIRDSRNYQRNVYIPGWIRPRNAIKMSGWDLFSGFKKLGDFSGNSPEKEAPWGLWKGGKKAVSGTDYKFPLAGGSLAGQKPTFP